MPGDITVVWWWLQIHFLHSVFYTLTSNITSWSHSFESTIWIKGLGSVWPVSFSMRRSWSVVQQSRHILAPFGCVLKLTHLSFCLLSVLYKTLFFCCSLSWFCWPHSQPTGHTFVTGWSGGGSCRHQLTGWLTVVVMECKTTVLGDLSNHSSVLSPALRWWNAFLQMLKRSHFLSLAKVYP